MRWKKNKVVSLQLRDGSVALLQMLESRGQVAVFNKFDINENCGNLQLEESMVLFYAWIAKDVLKRSVISEPKNVLPCGGLIYPNKFVDEGSGSRMVTFWPDESEERKIIVMGGDRLTVCCVGVDSNGSYTENHTEIRPCDYEKYASIEVRGLRGYPEFNERLYLCSVKGCNYDPLKEIAFARELGKENLVYIDIIGGKVKLVDLGY